MPSYAEYEEGLQNLDQCSWKVDYVITHTCSADALKWLSLNFEELNPVDNDQMHDYFNEIKGKLEYEKWFFGHFHHNQELPEHQHLLYDDIIKLT